MNKDPRVDQLLNQLYYAQLEYNLTEAQSIITKIRSLGYDTPQFDEIISTIRLARHPENEDYLLEEVDIAIGEDDEDMAERDIDEILETAPFCLGAYYFMLYIAVDDIRTYDPEDMGYIYEGHRKKAVAAGAKGYYLPRNEYQTAWHMLIAAEDYEAAREIQYKLGKEALKENRFEEAARHFDMARNHKDAMELARQANNAAEDYRRFKKEVPNDFLSAELEKRSPDLLLSYRNARSAVRFAPDGYGWLCVIGFVMAFILSVAMLGDAEMDKNELYILFPVFMTIGVHRFFEMELNLWTDGIIAAVSLFAPKLLNMASFSLFDSHIAGFIVLALITAIPAGYTLVQQLRALPASLYEKKATRLREELNREVYSIQQQLINKYSPSVGKDIARQWVKGLQYPKF